MKQGLIELNVLSKGFDGKHNAKILNPILNLHKKKVENFSKEISCLTWQF
jgi:hypothetical protein